MKRDTALQLLLCATPYAISNLLFPAPVMNVGGLFLSAYRSYNNSDGLTKWNDLATLNLITLGFCATGLAFGITTLNSVMTFGTLVLSELLQFKENERQVLENFGRAGYSQ